MDTSDIGWNLRNTYSVLRRVSVQITAKVPRYTVPRHIRHCAKALKLLDITLVRDGEFETGVSVGYYP